MTDTARPTRSHDPTRAAELVVDARAALGEGPVWDADRGVLWWVDILGGLVHAFDPASTTDRTIEIGQAVGAVALREAGGLVVLGQDAVLGLDPESGRIEVLMAFEHGQPPLRSNDAKPDPAGHLWIDRMTFEQTPGTGSLHRLDAAFRLQQAIDGLTIPNGLAWGLAGRTMYFVESKGGTVRAYAFDPERGELGEGRELYRHAGRGGPDGLTVDEEGFLWVAIWNGGQVLRLSPAGAVVDSIAVPVSQVSSCEFGGADLADLYVTTAREGFTAEDAAREPHAGALFRVRPGVRGRPPFRFRG